ncbi:DinB family protein [Pontibacter roseus]|uniref:DinB family protein n=1 Tax=Pontibacter roseus TaxID=336989 RepID=UPI00036B90EA|nr:DinB family protein [Pontibacter roseus]
MPSTITQLAQATSRLQQIVTIEFSALDLPLLNHKPGPDSWSILECLEHLNRYSRYYNPALAKAIHRSPVTTDQQPIRYSWLGKKSLDVVRPGNGKKSKTIKHMNPHNSQLGPGAIQEFLRHQSELLQLLDRAHSVDLNRRAIPIEFFRLLKLRIGEALEFVVLHQERHVQQALRVKQQLQEQASGSIIG